MSSLHRAGADAPSGDGTPSHTLTPVPNIGDEAYHHAAGVLRSEGRYHVVVNSRECPNELEYESAIARKVMEKMK